MSDVSTSQQQDSALTTQGLADNLTIDDVRKAADALRNAAVSPPYSVYVARGTILRVFGRRMDKPHRSNRKRMVRPPLYVRW